MARVGRIAILTVICCGFPFTANRASAASFEITHWTDYVYMSLPGTLGESTTFDWSPSFGWDVNLSGLPGVEDGADARMSGIAHLGPLLSLDEELNPDGSIGSDYIIGKGKFELELVFNLLDGTPHTMAIRGATGPVHISVQDDGWYPTSNEVVISLLNAKVDGESAALFGMKRQVSGSTYYFTDVHDRDPDRQLALFGEVFFDYTPVKHSRASDLNAVPEPGALSLIGLGVAAAILRRRA